MRIRVLILGLLALTFTPAHAGKNAGGALIVHTNDAVPYYRYDYCGEFYDDPGTCENAGTRTDRDGAVEGGSIVWLIAAFEESADPVVTGSRFGLAHNVLPGFFLYWVHCGPSWSTEMADPGWPEEPATAGTRILYGSPIAGDHLFPVYYFNIEGSSGLYFGGAIHPNLGYAGYLDDSDPPLIDGITNFGQVRWFEPGFNDCPTAPGETIACCFTIGHCVLLPEGDCLELGGESQGPGSACDPNPCVQPDPGACCLVTGDCLSVDRYECADQDGAFAGEGSVCDPNPCPQPPVGACCVEGDCHIVDAFECVDLQGEYLGEGQPCNPNPCPHARACCLPSGSCILLYPEGCDVLGGVSQPPETQCDPNPCGTTDVEDAHTLPTTWGRVKAEYR